MESGRPRDREAYSYHTDARNGSGIGRRACLKLLGAATVSAVGIAAGSDTVRAASDGYGSAGHGEGTYGGEDSSGLVVSTLDPTSVTTTSARLTGELSDLGEAGSADCRFEWRAVGDSAWNATSARTLSSAGAFVAEIGGLVSGTDYEYRAAAVGSSGDTVAGHRVAFTTEGGSTAPAVESYSVTEAGAPNPHCEITAEWSVSDSDGDLDTVTVAVLDASGTAIVSSTTSVSGGRDGGTDEITIKHAKGRAFDVTVTVTDASGNSDSRTRSVTE